MSFLQSRRMAKLIIIAFSLLTPVASSFANLDIPDYPDSVRLYVDKSEGPSRHQILLSTPKRINNSLQIEAQKIITGGRTNELIELKSGHSILDASSFYTDFLETNGELLYSCEKRACGSSNYWANKIFKEHRLYGRDSNQFYLAGKLKQGKEMLWVSVYGVKNGLKQSLIYLSVITDANSLHSTPLNSSEPESGISSKLDKGYLLFKQNIPDMDLVYLRDLLKVKSNLHLYLAAYSSLEADSVSLNLSALNEDAKQMKSYLLDALSVESSRLHLQVIGPFGSDYRASNEQIWYRIFILKP